MLRALGHRNFRLFFAGQCVSLVGTWMQQVAMVWLVYRLSNSAFLLGLVGFCSQLPILFFAPVAGVFMDRWNLHRVILTTQFLSMLQAAVLASLSISGVIATWQVIGLNKLFLGGPGTLGVMTASVGMGALGGALFLASSKTVVGLGRKIAIANAVFGLGLIAFSLSRLLWVSLIILVITGFALMLATSASNTVLQTVVDDDKRGRVMSLYATALLGMAPLGSLLAGSLASHFGEVLTVQLAGAASVFSALWFASKLSAIRRIVRPIYHRIGVLPEVTSGVAASACMMPDEEDNHEPDRCTNTRT
jgi:MFS family permease